MPKYLVEASYTTEGLKGLAKDGGSGRVKAIRQAAEGMGGKLETFYFSFGGNDAIVIVDLPDNASCAALSLAASASGAVRTRTTVLLTPEEMDKALKMKPGYLPPGKK
jgi:uncharacterized protein with GYD domain